MSKSVRNVIYILIIVVCVISIFVGVYAQFFMKSKEKKVDPNSIGGPSATNEISSPEIKDAFKDLFVGKFFDYDYDESGVEKIVEDEKIVYTAIDQEREEDGKYSIKVKIPFVNIKDVNYNDTTTQIFINKLNDIMKNSKYYTICDINYTAYINNDVLSVAIMASMKEGDSAQRLIVQTYNYNLKTKKDVTINDILEARGLEESAITKRIKYVVEKAAEDAKSIHDTGYEIYERNLDDEIYEVANVDNFIQGPNGELYIIYAYGNNAFTSEMDIIEV